MKIKIKFSVALIFLILSCPLFCLSAEEVKVNLDYKDAELSSVLRSLAYAHNLNLVSKQDIKGKVTLSLSNVTVDEALNAVLNTNNYAFTRKGELIYITEGPGLENMDVITVMLPLKYLVASEASMLLQKVISSKGDIRINESTNSLVITDFPSSIENVKKALEVIDTAPIQVLIEAKLVDITEKDYENFGLSYTVDYKPVGGGLFDRKTSYPEELAGSQSMAGPSTNLTGGQFKLTTITFKGISGTVTLDALIQKNKAHVLASPSITTLNGKEARIIIGERYPYKEKLTTTTGTIESTKFADIGTTLRVTPRVSPDGYITMLVHPEVSTLTSALDAGPRIGTREADATIRVKDGETFVIGGLIRREDTRNKGKVPILGYIPLIGALFSKSSADLSSTELVVFITPRIIAMDRTEYIERNETAVSIKGAGRRALVNKLWEEAHSLEDNEGVESISKDKDTRMADALDHYKQIALQFPESEKADAALYRASQIAYNYFSDFKMSEQMLLRLIDKYPDSLYVKRAQKMLSRVQKAMAKKRR